MKCYSQCGYLCCNRNDHLFFTYLKVNETRHMGLKTVHYCLTCQPLLSISSPPFLAFFTVVPPKLLALLHRSPPSLLVAS
ncbi:hypothetical protein ACHQM5_004485 [Ranunculus cassubicifolius]